MSCSLQGEINGCLVYTQQQDIFESNALDPALQRQHSTSPLLNYYIPTEIFSSMPQIK